jgi:hypothetical protein
MARAISPASSRHSWDSGRVRDIAIPALHPSNHTGLAEAHKGSPHLIIPGTFHEWQHLWCHTDCARRRVNGTALEMRCRKFPGRH